MKHPEIITPWFHDSDYLVVLSCPDEAALLALAERAPGLFHVQREPDLDNTATAVVYEPNNGPNRHLLSCYPLAFKEYREVAMV